MIIYEDYITTTDFKQNWNVVVIAALSVLVLILTVRARSHTEIYCSPICRNMWILHMFSKKLCIE